MIDNHGDLHYGHSLMMNNAIPTVPNPDSSFMDESSQSGEVGPLLSIFLGFDFYRKKRYGLLFVYLFTWGGLFCWFICRIWNAQKQSAHAWEQGIMDELENIKSK